MKNIKLKKYLIYVVAAPLAGLLHFVLYCIFDSGWKYPAGWFLTSQEDPTGINNGLLMFGNSMLMGTIVSAIVICAYWWLKSLRYDFDVFISYRHDDKKKDADNNNDMGGNGKTDSGWIGPNVGLAKDLNAFLEKRGLVVSLDIRRHLGDYSKTLRQGIAKSRNVIFLKTQGALDPREDEFGNDWVYEELRTARDKDVNLVVVTKTGNDGALPDKLPNDIREYLRNHDEVEVDNEGKTADSDMENLFGEDNLRNVETKEQKFLRWFLFGLGHVVVLLIAALVMYFTLRGNSTAAPVPVQDKWKPQAIMLETMVNRVVDQLDTLAVDELPGLKQRAGQIRDYQVSGKNMLKAGDWKVAVQCFVNVTNEWSVLLKDLADHEERECEGIVRKMGNIPLSGHVDYKNQLEQVKADFDGGKRKLEAGDSKAAVEYFVSGRSKWTALVRVLAEAMKEPARQLVSEVRELGGETVAGNSKFKEMERSLADGNSLLKGGTCVGAMEAFIQVRSLADQALKSLAEEQDQQVAALEKRMNALAGQCEGVEVLSDLAPKFEEMKQALATRTELRRKGNNRGSIREYSKLPKMWSELEETMQEKLVAMKESLDELVAKANEIAESADDRVKQLCRELAKHMEVGRTAVAGKDFGSAIIEFSQTRKCWKEIVDGQQSADKEAAIALSQRVVELRKKIAPFIVDEVKELVEGLGDRAESLRQSIQEGEHAMESEDYPLAIRHFAAATNEVTAVARVLNDSLKSWSRRADEVEAWVQGIDFHGQSGDYLKRKESVMRQLQEGRAAKAARRHVQALQDFAAVVNGGEWLMRNLAKITPAGTSKVLILPGGVKLEMVYCPPGTFMMGSPVNSQYRSPDELQHQVNLTKGFWIGKYEVSQTQWNSLMRGRGNAIPPFLRNDQNPVVQVSCKDCEQFCRSATRRIRELNGGWHGTLRLPTEAEWEYACRAGSTGQFAWGDGIDALRLNCDITMGRQNVYAMVRPVGSYPANNWGICDMHGNALEWCSDYYGTYSPEEVVDPRGPSSGTLRVQRGGGWMNPPMNCRSASRFAYDPAKASWCSGFRVCCSE